MTLFMPPIQRKKRVDEKYNPDSFRVISEHAVSDHPKYKPIQYRASFEPRTPTPSVNQSNNAVSILPLTAQPMKYTRVLPQILPDHRKNKPQTRSCGFLDRNVRFLNEPICHVYTAPVQHEEDKWWPSRPNPEKLIIPPYAEDTHYRKDYNYRHGERPQASGRHSSNVNREPALGVVPVNYLRERDGSQRCYKEGLSYEHLYNSRSDRNYPIRGKRHGAFVWSRMDPLSQKKFVEYYQRLEEQEKSDTFKSAAETSQSAVVVRSRNNSNAAAESLKRHSSTTSLRSNQSQKVEAVTVTAAVDEDKSREKVLPLQVGETVVPPQVEIPVQEVQQKVTPEVESEVQSEVKIEPSTKISEKPESVGETEDTNTE